MRKSPLGRILRIYRTEYAQERRQRDRARQARPESRAKAGFWNMLGLASLLTILDSALDPQGAAWLSLRLAVALIWAGFAVWYLSEAWSRWRSSRAGG